MRREFFSKPGRGRRQAVQCGECIAKHGLAVEATNRLVERPKRLRKISIELKEQKALRDLDSRATPGGPGRGTAPAGQVWRLPGAHGARRRFPARGEGPC